MCIFYDSARKQFLQLSNLKLLINIVFQISKVLTFCAENLLLCCDLAANEQYVGVEVRVFGIKHFISEIYYSLYNFKIAVTWIESWRSLCIL